MKGTAPETPAARSLAGICRAARQANCGECWQVPGKPCTPDGDHVARFGRAMRRGLISGPDLLAVLGTLDAFTTATVICDAPGWCPVSPCGRGAAGTGAPGDEPWARTSDRSVWRAYKSGLVLTVTHLVTGGWQAVIEGPGVTRRSPVLGSRGAAQAWADDRVRGAS